jgi:hypothetical protein
LAALLGVLAAVGGVAVGLVVIGGKTSAYFT